MPELRPFQRQAQLAITKPLKAMHSNKNAHKPTSTLLLYAKANVGMVKNVPTYETFSLYARANVKLAAAQKVMSSRIEY